MCNEYARRLSLDDLTEAFSDLKLPPFVWRDGLIPNDLDCKASVRISDTAPVVRFDDDRLMGSMTPWGWKGPHGKPVFNFVSEGRDFSNSDRVLVLADGFYEHTAPRAAKIKLKDRHLFELVGAPWFWIAAIVRNGAFALLTTAPGPDLVPFHDRQIVVLRPSCGLDWLSLRQPISVVLAPLPAGSFSVTTLRRDGLSVV